MTHRSKVYVLRGVYRVFYFRISVHIETGPHEEKNEGGTRGDGGWSLSEITPFKIF